MEQITQLKILQTLKKLESRLDKIEKILIENNNSSKKMEEHIEFIDGIYDVIRKPVSKVLSMCNNTAIELENKNIIKNE